MLPPTPASDFQSTQCKLHLHAVLPVLKELCEFSKEAKSLITNWQCVLKLVVIGGPSALLISQGDGKLKVLTSGFSKKSIPKVDITLFFFSESHLNRTFLGKNFPPPIPVGLPWKLGKIGVFQKLTQLLESYLRPKTKVVSKDFDTAQAKMLLRIATNAIPIIGSHDTIARDLMAHTPSGYAEFQVREWGAPVAWLYWNKGETRLMSGSGSLPNRLKADVSIIFKDQKTVSDAVCGRLDNLAAVGLGDISVFGLIPLADSLGVLMDRVDLYLPR